MMFDTSVKDFKERLEEQQIKEWEDYCKSQGFTDEQTKVFIKNSLKNLYPDYETTD